MSIRIAGAALAAAFALAVAAPSMAAAPAALAPLKSLGLEQSNVEKTHGWHRRCRRGFSDWHKHVPGVGRVQCRTARNCYRNWMGNKVCDWF